MRFVGGDGRSAGWRGTAPALAMMALAVGTMPAAAQTTETATPAVHPAHHVRHHARPARPLAETHPSGAAAQAEPSGQSPGAAKPSTAAPSATAAAPTGAGAATAKTETPPAPAPSAAAAPEAKPAAEAKPPAETKPSAEAKPAAPAQSAQAAPAKSLLDPEVAKGYVGQPVYGRKGQELGELSEVTTGPDGKVKSATITWGGLFGYFRSSRTIDWPTTDPTLKDGKLVLGGITRQQFRNGEQPQASR